MPYFVMTDEGVYPALPLKSEPELPCGPWCDGSPVTIPLPNPLVYVLDTADVDEDDEEDEAEDYSVKHLYGAASYPIMSRTLADILLQLGIDNIEFFPAQLHDPNTQTVLDYVAFNVLGLVAATDIAASETMQAGQAIDLLDTDFASLALDDSKTYGLDIFYLAENCSALIVSDRVKAAIEAAKLPGFVFYGSGEWAG